jgi:hypothetical protein
MNLLTTFDSTKESLLTLLTSINNGNIQLPDFQRGWVWDDEHIRDLLVSISLSYPIGTLMLIETGNPEVKFKPRLVEGVTRSRPPQRDLKRLLACFVVRRYLLREIFLIDLSLYPWLQFLLGSTLTPGMTEFGLSLPVGIGAEYLVSFMVVLAKPSLPEISLACSIGLMDIGSLILSPQ